MQSQADFHADVRSDIARAVAKNPVSRWVKTPIASARWTLSWDDDLTDEGRAKLEEVNLMFEKEPERVKVRKMIRFLPEESGRVVTDAQIIAMHSLENRVVHFESEKGHPMQTSVAEFIIQRPDGRYRVATVTGSLYEFYDSA